MSGSGIKKSLTVLKSDQCCMIETRMKDFRPLFIFSWIKRSRSINIERFILFFFCQERISFVYFLVCINSGTRIDEKAQVSVKTMEIDLKGL